MIKRAITLNMSNSTALSVIILTKDKRGELQKTLQSLKEQDIIFELIVVDNGSSDDPHEIVQRNWPSAFFIRLERNEGVPKGRNEGMKAAQGDIVVFLDDDAGFASPDALSRIQARFETTEDLGILAANSRLESGEPDKRAIPRRDKKDLDHDYEASYFSGCGYAVRKSVLEKTGYYFEKFFYGCEEPDLSWRVLDIGYRIVRAADIKVIHRRSPKRKTTQRWVFYNARNRIWLAARHLPWRFVASYILFWWGYLFGVALKNAKLRSYVKGIAACLSGLPEIIKTRRPVSKATLNLIRKTNGRLYY
jgi:GT2 family glycosyltransferase